MIEPKQYYTWKSLYWSFKKIILPTSWDYYYEYFWGLNTSIKFKIQAW